MYFLLVTLPVSLLFLNYLQCVSSSCWERSPVCLLCPAGNCAQCASCALLGTVPSMSTVPAGSCTQYPVLCLLGNESCVFLAGNLTPVSPIHGELCPMCLSPVPARKSAKYCMIPVSCWELCPVCLLFSVCLRFLLGISIDSVSLRNSRDSQKAAA